MEYGLNPLIIFYLGKLFRQKMDAKSILEPIFTLITPGAPHTVKLSIGKWFYTFLQRKLKKKKKKEELEIEDPNVLLIT